MWRLYADAIPPDLVLEGSDSVQHTGKGGGYVTWRSGTDTVQHGILAIWNSTSRMTYAEINCD